MTRAAVLIVALLGWPGVAAAQVSAPPKVLLLDEATPLARVGSVNCAGAGITCTVSGDQGTLTVAGGGGGGSANVVEVSIDLGTSGGLVYTATVTSQAWVAAGSVIVCSPFGTTDDGQTIETYAAAGFSVLAATRVAGTGFDLWIQSPRGATGTFRFHCTGA